MNENSNYFFYLYTDVIDYSAGIEWLMDIAILYRKKILKIKKTYYNRNE